MNQVKINGFPKFPENEPDNYTHSIQLSYPLDEDGVPLNITIYLNEVTGYLPFRNPSHTEWEHGINIKIELTSEETVRDPEISDFSKQGPVTMNYRGEFISCKTVARGKYLINKVSESVDAADIKSDDNFGLALEKYFVI